MFRPGYIQPVRGVVSSTGWYRALYAGVAPLYPLFSRLFPRSLVTSAEVGRALLQAARAGAPKKILDPADIAALAGRAG